MKKPLILSITLVLFSGLYTNVVEAQYRFSESDKVLMYDPMTQPATVYKTVQQARWRSVGYTGGSIILGSGLSYLADNNGPSAIRTAGSLIVIGGIIIGPSAGSIYADDWSRSIRGILIRSGAFVITGVGGVFVLSGAFGGDQSLGGLGTVLVTTGILTGIGSMLHDTFISSRKSVEEYNQRINNSSSSVQIYPWMRGNFEGAGISASIQF